MKFSQDHVALICGGTAPIGAAIAEKLVLGGLRNLAVAGRDVERGNAVIERLRSLAKGDYRFIRTDLAEAGSAEKMISQAAGAFGNRIDSYVHCVPAGAAPGVLVSADQARFEASLALGLGQLAASCRAAVTPLTATKGSMLLFTSDAGKLPGAGKTLVAALQSGVIAFARGLALELARDSVRVNAISPTYVRGTPLFDRIASSEGGARSLASAAARAPLGLPEPKDIAELAAFLLSQSASRITGQVISINGGLSAA